MEHGPSCLRKLDRHHFGEWKIDMRGAPTNSLDVHCSHTVRPLTGEATKIKNHIKLALSSIRHAFVTCESFRATLPAPTLTKPHEYEQI